MTVNGLNAATEVIIPMETAVMNLNGLAQILGYVEMVRERLNPEIRVSGFLLAAMTPGKTGARTS